MRVLGFRAQINNKPDIAMDLTQDYMDCKTAVKDIREDELQIGSYCLGSDDAVRTSNLRVKGKRVVGNSYLENRRINLLHA